MGVGVAGWRFEGADIIACGKNGDRSIVDQRLALGDAVSYNEVHRPLVRSCTRQR